MSNQRRVQTKVFKEMIKIGNSASHISVYTCQPKNKEDLEKADIVIVTQGEDGEEAIPLTWCDKGSFRGNVISDVDIKAGAVNTIQFRFEDNIKHLISLVAYVSK